MPAIASVVLSTTYPGTCRGRRARRRALARSRDPVPAASEPPRSRRPGVGAPVPELLPRHASQRRMPFVVIDPGTSARQAGTLVEHAGVEVGVLAGLEALVVATDRVVDPTADSPQRHACARPLDRRLVERGGPDPSIPSRSPLPGCTPRPRRPRCRTRPSEITSLPSSMSESTMRRTDAVVARAPTLRDPAIPAGSTMRRAPQRRATVRVAVGRPDVVDDDDLRWRARLAVETREAGAEGRGRVEGRDDHGHLDRRRDRCPDRGGRREPRDRGTTAGEPTRTRGCPPGAFVCAHRRARTRVAGAGRVGPGAGSGASASTAAQAVAGDAGAFGPTGVVIPTAVVAARSTASTTTGQGSPPPFGIGAGGVASSPAGRRAPRRRARPASASRDGRGPRAPSPGGRPTS